MSLRMTQQMEWVHLARYSTYHPDNLNRAVDNSLVRAAH